MKTEFTLALVQLRIVPGEFRGNLEHALVQIRAAARAEADLVLLPEALPFGWMDHHARSFASEIPDGEMFQAFKAAAIEHKIHVCTGLVEKSGDKIFNSAVLISPEGKLLLHHRKINELQIAHDCYDLGDRLAVAETQLGRIGLIICADAFAPGQVLSRALGLMGAQLILSPCAWAVPPGHDNSREPYGQLWRDNYSPVARAFGLWIAGCSNVGPIHDGPWKNHNCIGCSLVIDPDGNQHLQGTYGPAAEEILTLKIETRAISRPAA